MKRIFVIVLSTLLLATGIGGITTPNVSATPSGVIVIINGQPLKEDQDSSAFKSGNMLMIPLKVAANSLKYKVIYVQNTGTIQLNGINEKIEVKVRENQMIFNGREKIDFKDDVIIREDRLFVPLSFLTAMGLVTTYDADSNLAEVYTPEVTAGAIAGLLTSGQYQELENRFFSDILKRTITVSGLHQSWDGLSARAGNYYGIKSTQSSHNEEQFSIQCVLDFAETEASLEIVLNKSGKIIELRENMISK